MEVLMLALRYLRTKRMALLACIFLAVAVCAMVVVTSVMSGFQARLLGHIRTVEPDLTFRLKARPLPQDTFETIRSELMGEMERAGGPLRALAPRFQTTALLGNKLEGPSGGSRSSTISVSLVGVDWERDARVVDWGPMLSQVKSSLFTLKVPPGENPLTYFPLGGLLLSDVLARSMGFIPGEGPFAASDASVVIGSFATDRSGQTVIEPSNRTFTVAGCFNSGRDDHDGHVIYVDLLAFRELRYGGAPDAPDAVQVVARLADRSAVQTEARALRQRHPALAVETWEDRNRTLVTALRVERVVISAVLFFIILLASLLLLGILYMIVVEKRRDVGILRSMGLSRLRTVGVFVTYGSFLGVIGVTLGAGLGIVMVQNMHGITHWLGEELGVQVFAPDAYRDREIPALLDLGGVGLISLCALGVTVGAAGVAALKAVQATPVENLRYE